MIGRLREPDHTILMLNLVLLLWIGVLPFSTELMAAYLREGHGENLAAAVYAGSLLMMSITFAGLNRHILFPKSHLLAVELSSSGAERSSRAASSGWFRTRSRPRSRPSRRMSRSGFAPGSRAFTRCRWPAAASGPTRRYFRRPGQSQLLQRRRRRLRTGRAPWPRRPDQSCTGHARCRTRPGSRSGSRAGSAGRPSAEGPGRDGPRAQASAR